MRRSPLLWLCLQSMALWPHGLWAWRRMSDGSDDPLGLVALIALAALVLRHASRLRTDPEPRWLALSALLTGTSAVALYRLPPLATSLLGVLALSAALIAWLPREVARLPFAGLAVLALPLLSSLQFYIGYPLRLVTAQISSTLLQLAGIDAERSGASMRVMGHLVIVDAPCSGVQMAWLAYFTAFVAAALGEVRDRVVIRRLPWVGALVLAGNALRNSVLVLFEARPAVDGSLAQLVHQGVGLAMLALVCALVLRAMRGGWRHAQPA